MPGDAWSRDEAKGYKFGADAVAAPEGYDPDATGFIDPPVGVHEMEIVDYYLKENHDFTVNEGGVRGSVRLYQLRPKFRIVAGQPHAGATIMDFLPCPTPNTVMPPKLANRWGNFLRGCGFDLPAGMLAPSPDFGPEDLIGRRVRVHVVQQVRDDVPQLKADGTPQMQVKYFGYEPVNKAAPGPAAPPAPSNNGRKAAKPAQSAPAAAAGSSDKWDL